MNQSCKIELQTSFPVILITFVLTEAFKPTIIPTLKPQLIKLYRFIRLKFKELNEWYIFMKTKRALSEQHKVARNNAIGKCNVAAVVCSVV